MKRLSNIIVAAAVSMMLTGCGLYNKYEKTVQEPADPFGTTQDITSATSETSIADMSWREFFTDSQLQQLIEQAQETGLPAFALLLTAGQPLQFRWCQSHKELHSAIGYLLGYRRVRFHEK